MTPQGAMNNLEGSCGKVVYKLKNKILECGESERWHLLLQPRNTTKLLHSWWGWKIAHLSWCMPF